MGSRPQSEDEFMTDRIGQMIRDGTHNLDPRLVEDREYWDMDKTKEFINDYRPDVDVDSKPPKELDRLAGAIQKENL
jgi:hypothetical protein